MTENKVFAEKITLWTNSIQPNLTEALNLIPDKHLYYAPAEGMLELGNIFLHLSESSDWWYDELMKGNESVQLICDEPKKKVEIMAAMEIHWERLERFFKEKAETFDKTYKFEYEGDVYNFTGHWIFNHIFEHDIHHRSQINQYLRILGLTPPKV